MNLILFGFKGSGKTYYGKRLSERLGWYFIDLDQKICEDFESKTKKVLTIREIYQLLGEEGFRELESRAILHLKGIAKSILAVGGGAVLEPKNVALLHLMGQLIYIAANFETVKKRILREGMPSIVKTVEDLENLYRERLPIYESIPAKKIAIDHFDEAAVLTSLLETEIINGV